MPRAPLSILKEVFGYPAFRGRQGEIVEHVTNGGSALVLMPTGGSTAAAMRFRMKVTQWVRAVP